MTRSIFLQLHHEQSSKFTAITDFASKACCHLPALLTCLPNPAYVHAAQTKLDGRSTMDELTIFLTKIFAEQRTNLNVAQSFFPFLFDNDEASQESLVGSLIQATGTVGFEDCL